MGPANAENAIRSLLKNVAPQMILSCGFAGGLNLELGDDTVVFSVDAETGLEPALLTAGARPGRFHCARQVATTAIQKQQLRSRTGADAVDMESDVIRDACRVRQIPFGIIRVILDTAAEDLPLDFNRLMTPNQTLDYRKLAICLLRSPSKIRQLLHLRKQSARSAAKLADVLEKVILR